MKLKKTLFRSFGKGNYERFNTIAKNEYNKEAIQKKLLDIQHYLLTVILEIASIIAQE